MAREGVALFPFWTKQFGISDALGIQLLPLGRLLRAAERKAASQVTENFRVRRLAVAHSCELDTMENIR